MAKKKVKTKVRVKREPCGGYPKVIHPEHPEWKGTVSKAAARNLSLALPDWIIDPKNKAKL